MKIKIIYKEIKIKQDLITILQIVPKTDDYRNNKDDLKE